MLGYLAGVPGRLKTLADRLTATWAAKLDTLHDTRITSARAGYLDKLNITGNVAGAGDLTALAHEASPILAVPKASGLSANIATSFDLTSTTCTALDNLATTTSTSFVDVVNYTGSGVLEFCAFMPATYGSADYATMEILIDGVTVYSGTSTAAGMGANTKIPVGAATGSAATLGAVPFKTSLQIRHKTSNAAVYCKTAYKLRKVA